MALLAVIRAFGSNVLSTIFKMFAYSFTGSSGMLAETLHGAADCINQALLFIGEHQLTLKPDRHHPYGYGRSPFFWSLISAMGTFWMGSVVSISYGFYHILYPVADLDLSMWSISALGFSFLLDGWVLTKTIGQLRETQPQNVGFIKHIQTQKNPTLLAVFLEDIAACTGVIIGSSGMFLSYYTTNMIYDSVSSILIGCLLAGVSYRMIALNQNYLLGRALDPLVENEIVCIVRGRRSIDNVYKNILNLLK